MIHLLKKQFYKNCKRYRNVNTWSPLATAFNSINKETYGFDFSKKKTGLFGIFELKTSDGFNVLKDQAISQTNALIAESINQNRKRKMVEIFDEMSDTLCKVADLAEFIRIAHPEKQFVTAAEDACLFISSIVEKLNTHRELYHALKHVVHNGDIQETSVVDKHVATLFLSDFELCAIHLPESIRENVVQLNYYILQVGQKFMAGTTNARAVDANIVPPNIRQYFTEKDNKVYVQGLYIDSSSYLLRETAYRIFLYPDDQQEYLLQELLNCRHTLATLCGFSSYAHRAVKGSTVETPEVIYEFLNILNDNLKLKARQDFNEMQKMKDVESPIKQHVVHNGDIQETSVVDKHVATLFLSDFELCAIHLPESIRENVVQLNYYILQVGQKFMAGTTNARAVDANIVPPNIRQYFTEKDNKVYVQGLYIDSSSYLLRETAYRIFLYPDDQQEYLLQELLNCRHTLATLCGFSSYAHRAVKGSTVETPEVIYEFLNILNDNLKLKARQDFNEMQKMKDVESPIKQEIMPWDTAYFTAKAKKNWLNMTITEFAPYFSLGACMDGINILIQALYGIRLEYVPVLSGEVWANNVHKIAVIDENEMILGYIYCDFFERKGKPNQDCHFTIRGGRQLSDGSYQNPIVVLMLSLPVPTWSKPCLLTPASVENLFHEMGHALHSMLGRTKYQHVTGTRCSTDFAEVPSVLMEYFASDPRVVSTFAKHFQTLEQIPMILLDKLYASKNIFCASELQNQIYYSMLDQVYHSGQLEKSSTEILKEIQGKYYELPYVENTAWQLRFSHLVGYGAKYYSYLVSRAIASWIWQTYFEADPFNRTAGNRYRKECLEHGGGKPPSKLVSDFLNKEANAKNFAKSLLHEIDIKMEHVEKLRQ
ncbi:Mitochondrial intermediate peptidase [Eufriesea mexicana]|uniref:Mitochondrial intermediate peptidase n=1 Tax=Eufriesea mexicana TaxID=516756 RepID=A0A310SAQ1_9HYME|nr:Mitochondrial intermediate peptidase [Eufriesea mexicana]